MEVNLAMETRVLKPLLGLGLLLLFGFLAPGAGLAEDGPQLDAQVKVLDAGQGWPYYTTVLIGSSGNPLISYHDNRNKALKLVICQDAACTERKIYTPDRYGAGVSMGLNLGRPVMVHWNVNWLTHVQCESSGNCSQPTSTPLLKGPTAFSGPSLPVRMSGAPVMTYVDHYGGKLMLARCSDTTCTSPVSQKTLFDGASQSLRNTSLALTQAGSPVASFQDKEDGSLKLIVCHDPACSTLTLRTVDAGGPDDHEVGDYNSVALAAKDRPLISYYDATSGDLKLAICRDATCKSTQVTTVDNGRFLRLEYDVGRYTSLALNENGQPRISYYDASNENLKLATCTVIWEPQIDVRCNTRTVDSAGNVGEHNSLTLDREGRPVVSYRDATNQAVKLATCPDTSCSAPLLTTVADGSIVGLHTSLDLDPEGLPVISYYDQDGANLKAAACNDDACTAPSPTKVDYGSEVGRYSSLQVSGNGLPFISYYDATNGDLKLAVCTDSTCSSPTVKTVFSDGDVGQHTSLALQDNGLPVITFTSADGDFHLRDCTDLVCGSFDSFASFVQEDVGAEHTSLALARNDRTVFAAAIPAGLGLGYDDRDGLVPIAAGQVRHPSLALADEDLPAVSYYEDGYLRLLRCRTFSCAAFDLNTVDGEQGMNLGEYSSLAFDSRGLPVISYYDRTAGDLKLAVCQDANCQQNSPYTIDAGGDVGQYTSLAVDDQDTAFISYFDLTHGDLKLAIVELPGDSRPLSNRLYLPLTVRGASRRW